MKWLLLVGLCVASVSVGGEPRVYTLAIGRLNATVQEAQECVFPLGQGAAILLHPKGEPCVILRELVGRTGTLIFVLDDMP